MLEGFARTGIQTDGHRSPEVGAMGSYATLRPDAPRPGPPSNSPHPVPSHPQDRRGVVNLVDKPVRSFVMAWAKSRPPVAACRLLGGPEKPSTTSNLMSNCQ